MMVVLALDKPGWLEIEKGFNMCLAIPAKITQLLDDKRAIVNLSGVEKEISLALVDDIALGDYVIVHVGFALTRLNEQEAEKTLAIFSEMAILESKKS